MSAIRHGREEITSKRERQGIPSPRSARIIGVRAPGGNEKHRSNNRCFACLRVEGTFSSCHGWRAAIVSASSAILENDVLLAVLAIINIMPGNAVVEWPLLSLM